MILNGCLEQAGESTSESLEQTEVKVDRENEKHVGEEALQKRVCWKRTWILVAGVGVYLGKVLDFLLG